MSRPLKDRPVTQDWKKFMECPKCKDGRLRFEHDALVCDKCGHRKPFIVDNKKSRWIIDG